MALNFPDSPTLNQVYTDSTSGFSYQWNGTVWQSYSASTSSNISVVDDISGSFDNVTTIFPIAVGGVSYTPANAQQLRVVLGGIVQEPGIDYSISGSNILFTTAPGAGLDISIISFGTSIPVGVSTIGDVYNRQSYTVVGVQTDFSFPSGYTVGYLDVFRNGVRLIAGDDFTATTGNSFSLSPAAQDGDGVEAIGYKVSTIAITEGNLIDLIVNQNATVLGITTLGAGAGVGVTVLNVEGNARVTGILTVGTSSITLDGSNNEIKVGSGLTLSSTGITAGGITAGVVTATSFSGDGSGLTGVGPSSQNVTSVSGITTVDLSAGNVIYFTHDTDTTVAFANTSTTQEVTFIRQKDATTTSRTITWSPNIRWSGSGDAPTLFQNEGCSEVLSLVTRDGGVNWFGWEDQSFEGNNLKYIFAWGTNNSGELGQNNTIDYSSPVQIPGITWSSISGGNGHSLGTKTDGTLWSWGSNTYGQLGQNNVTNLSSPKQISGTTWSSISNGWYHSLATKTDGTLWVWGRNQNGQLGQNNQTSHNSPVQIPGNTWSSISGGEFHSLATKTDGTLWAWGGNSDGQLGVNNRTQYSSPIQIPGVTWSSVAAGENHSLATRSDGTLWSWGDGTNGVLGHNFTTNRSSPVQIPGNTWSSISSGSYHALATQTDGTLWAWGRNFNGQLGQGNRTNYSSPRQIPGNTWSSIGGGDEHTLATKTDGTLWAWGDGSNGQLGLNDATQYSSPVQIPGTIWGPVGVGFNHSLAIITKNQV